MTEIQTIQDVIKHTNLCISALEKKLAQKLTIDDRVVLEYGLTKAKEILKKSRHVLRTRVGKRKIIDNQKSLQSQLSEVKAILKRNEEAELVEEDINVLADVAIFIFVIYLLYRLYSIVRVYY